MSWTRRVAILLDALLQIGGHAGTHGAEADKASFHRYYL